MTRPRVLVTLWGLERLGRYRPQLEALQKHVDLHVLYYHPALEIDVDGVTWTKIGPPNGDIVSFRDVYEPVREAAMELPDVDVILAFSRPSSVQLLDVVLKTLLRKPIVLRAIGKGSEVRSHWMGASLVKAFSDAMDVVTLNNYDLIVPISSSVKAYIEELVLDEGRVTDPVPIGVETELYVPTPLPDELVVGYAGRISPEKGAIFMKEVMDLTPETRYEAAGRLQIGDYRFSDNCHYLGELRQADMPWFIDRCNVLILPSHSEAMSNVRLQAYSCGRPVIVSTDARVPEIPVFGWALPHEPDKWAKLIEGLDSREIEEEGRRAREWVCTQWPSWDDFGRVMCEKIMEVV